MWECGDEQTDINTQTAVANILFASAMPHSKCNKQTKKPEESKLNLTK